MPIPPKAALAANEIAVQVPGTKWTPQDRDLAAAIIGKYTKQEKAIEVCRELVAAFSRGRRDLNADALTEDLKRIHLLARIAMGS